MNPSAKRQAAQYAQSTTDLFKLMIQEKEEEFSTRIRKVFYRFLFLCLLYLIHLK